MKTEFNWTQPRIVVKRTLLSQKPAENSGLIAAAIAMVILFVTILVWRDSPGLMRLSAAVPSRVLDQHEYWRLFSAMAVHSDWKHLFSNLPFVVFFGYLLYGYFGFGVYPLGVVVLGALTNYLSLLTYPPEVHLVGASGMTHVMGGFWLTAYILVERSLPLKKRVLRSLGVALILFLPSAVQPEISYRAHAIGLVLGIVAAAVFFQRYKRRIRAAEVLEIEEDDDVSGPVVM
ncbi:MAG: rhomboid family intramembrane serine protease [Candidatus Aminicenantes bacterium]|nr:rhomboid family intramembrane serine protease [Candidatus Aminicenantes bacterium]